MPAPLPEPLFDSPEGPVRLPRPGAAVVALFDGQCGVCSRSAGLIGQRDTARLIERLDLRDPAAAERFPDLSTEAVRALMHVVDREGTVHIGLDAVLRVFDELPRWRWTARLLRIPGVHALANVGYRLFARHRLWFNRFLPAPVQAPACTGDVCAVDWEALQRAGKI
jgi:predicted DCC family thiol-disulfide oxidoreductase YuxK